jgi:hypothetical protein
MLDLDAILNPDEPFPVDTPGKRNDVDEPKVGGDVPFGFGPDDLPGDWRCEWEERAAIMEYDGGLPREHAEAAALADILDRIRRGERFGTICPCPACRHGNDACT